MFVEYAAVVSAIAVLVSSLTGSLASLPASNGAALAAVNAGARAQKVSPAAARAVYAKAPYRKPVLKYLYTLGWIGGKKNPLACLLARFPGDGVRQDVAAQLRKSPKLMRQLRRARVSLQTASTAVVRGIVSACS